jgi:3-methyladenine DNA glycosylase Mpg
MAERRGKLDLCTGPGKLTQALDIQMRHDAHDLMCLPLTLRYGDAPEGEIISPLESALAVRTELPYSLPSIDRS